MELTRCKQTGSRFSGMTSVSESLDLTLHELIHDLANLLYLTADSAVWAVDPLDRRVIEPLNRSAGVE